MELNNTNKIAIASKKASVNKAIKLNTPACSRVEQTLNLTVKVGTL